MFETFENLNTNDYQGTLVLNSTIGWNWMKTNNWDNSIEQDAYVTKNIFDLSHLISRVDEYSLSKDTFIRTLQLSETPVDSVELNVYNSLRSFSHPKIILTKDFEYEKKRDYLFIRRAGLRDLNSAYNSSTNQPQITLSWYDYSEDLIVDVAIIKLGTEYIPSRSTSLFGENYYHLNSTDINNYGIIVEAIADKYDVWDYLKTNTYEVNDVADTRFFLSDSSFEFEYETAYRITNEDHTKLYNVSSEISNIHESLPKFFSRHVKRDGNLNVIICGDSISARDYHTTYFSQEERTKRPPLMVSKNIGSAIYDSLTWENTEYARFDRSGYFTESGSTFLTVIANNTTGGGSSNGISQGDGQGGDEWYDIGDRPSDTRIYTGSSQASVAYDIPNDTYIANFIYRTDLKGCQNVTVSLGVGNGKWQVYNGSTWVEANGYVFSMRHQGNTNNRINTKFQERLRFRASDKYDGGTFDQRSSAATTFTFTKDNSNSRFLYWGVEWSQEPYIVTVINAARGGENIASVVPAINDDVYDWIDTPDAFSLVIHEIYLNQGQNSYNSTKSKNDFISEWFDYFYDSSNPLSFKEKSKTGSDYWDKFEAIQWNPNPTAAGNGIKLVEPYGWETWDNPTDGMKTVKDNFLCYLYDYIENRKEVGNVMINVTSALEEECKSKIMEKNGDKAFYIIIWSKRRYLFITSTTHPNELWGFCDYA